MPTDPPKGAPELAGGWGARNMPNDTPVLALRPREAAASIGISPRTLDRLIAEGRIRSVKLGPSAASARLIPVAELQRFLAEHLAPVAERTNQGAGE